MSLRSRRCLSRITASIALIGATAVLASCAGDPTPKASVASAGSKEYFSESEYGVKASPKVSMKRSGLKRGGGRDQTGKPYKVRGKWYYPKEDPDYVKVGAASWYGSAFHGRLTANGEVYDMTHLTAAHPTMPLPSYARVTNMKNGSSVVVRVNDRGPFAHGRVIDLSKRAAEMLDYTHSGVAKVKVEYVGRAPLHGQDDQYLMASYRPGDQDGGPEEISPGVMIAMNGPTPSAPVSALAAATAQAGPIRTAITDGDPLLPAFGPSVPERPLPGGLDAPVAVAALSYADQRVARAAGAFDAMLAGQGAPQTPPAASSGKADRLEAPQAATDYIAVGTFADRNEAQDIIAALAAHGRPELIAERGQDGSWYTVNLRPDGRAPLDDMLRRAWAAGADQALTVRD
ncbi:septal ring lytic transglycosylase RlpA family protein [Nitratireductor sp. CAU 1489]|uniref:Endolytic peptidoglycan transglycosylase RlpA n=1 Tax=Nitratireductor arenosus TaxID=2682096 RepID=A0A844QIM6_9HYPH|nr:septal ring lytic transglycosylase RlpA family protein [Nitratireductor arenosus]MVA97830.1 septal ring lytic transglycosylase RlpA family protein [Nitratireductor arenosus]